MRARNIFIIIFVFFVITITIIFSFGRYIFKLRKVQISKDFQLDKEKILDYLEIYPLRSIWEYDLKVMEEKLSKHFYLKEYSISKRYPNTLFIKVKIREPLACIAGANGNLYVIDREGVIFRKADHRDNLMPLLIFRNREQFKEAIRLRGLQKEVIEELYILREDFGDIYRSVSQIEINNNRNFGIDYIVNFKTLKQRVYLKNKIDVDSIIKGLSCALFLENAHYNNKNILYTGNAFAF